MQSQVVTSSSCAQMAEEAQQAIAATKKRCDDQVAVEQARAIGPAELRYHVEAEGLESDPPLTEITHAGLRGKTKRVTQTRKQN